MMQSNFYSLVGSAFILASLLVAGYTIWFMSTGRDKKYIEKLNKFNEQSVSVKKKISPQIEEEIPRTVRDFIYIDGDRLYSLYSQIFQGVADSVVQSYFGSSGQKSSYLKQSESLEANVAEAVLHTENKVLYDHMYNLLEKRIGTRVIEVSGISLSNYHEEIENSSFLRIHGTVEIEDYDRLQEFMSHFNEIADAIAYANIYSQNKLSEAIRKAEEAANQISDPNKRATAKNKFDINKDPKKLAREMGLRQDDQIIKNLELFAKLFHGGGFDVTISPSVSSDIVYKGSLNRKWLRIQPEMLRSLYGTTSKSNWVMVGYPTFIPSVGNEDDETDEEKPDIISDNSPSMRDSFKDMFGASKAFETMFQKSKKRVEIIIAPLAIYREIEIETK